MEFLFIRTDGGTIANNVIRTSHDATTIVDRTTMRIIGVTEANAGEYQCIVRNVSTDENAISLGRRNFTIHVSGITTMKNDNLLLYKAFKEQKV